MTSCVLPLHEFTHTWLYLSSELYFLFQLFTATCFLRQGFEVDEGGEAPCAQMSQTLWFAGTLSHRRGDGTHLLPFHLSLRQEADYDKQLCSAAQGPGLQKPRADNECHTIVTACTFMERRRRTFLAHTLTVYDGTSSINQTIKEWVVKHLWNLWREPWLIYDHYWKRAVSKWMYLELNCGKSEEI